MKSPDLQARDIVLAVCVSAAIITALALYKDIPAAPVKDALIYVRLALGLVEFGTFSNFLQSDVTPALSYEVTPLYPVFLAILAKLDPALRASLICVIEHADAVAACPNSYWSVVIGQGAAMVVLPVSVWATTWLISRRRAAAWLALIAVLVCTFPITYARLMLTEALILPLFGAFTLVLLLAVQRRGQILWPVLTGILVALLALTRPAFVYVFWFMAFSGIAIALYTRQWRAIRAALFAFTIAYGVMVLPWIARNHIQLGHSALSESAFGARALSDRIGYNRMTGSEWRIAFIYWLPDFGDRIAEQLFEPKSYERLGWGENSLYQRAVREILPETLAAAGGKENHLNYLLRTEVFAHPVWHFLVSLPLAWRALFIDNGWGILGWICCLRLLWLTARQREWAYWILCLPPFFLIPFHAAVSVSITRYSISLIPVLSIAIGIALMRLAARSAFLKSRFPWI